MDEAATTRLSEARRIREDAALCMWNAIVEVEQATKKATDARNKWMLAVADVNRVIEIACSELASNAGE